MSVNVLGYKLSKFKNILTPWHNFWFMEMDPFTIGIFRISLGIVLFFYYMMLAPSWIDFYGPNGMGAAKTLSLHEYNFHYSVLNIFSSNFSFLTFYYISLCSTVCLILGVFNKLPILWLWLSNFSIMYRNLNVLNGEEQIFALILFFAIFLPLNSSLTYFQLTSKEKRKKNVHK